MKERKTIYTCDLCSKEMKKNSSLGGWNLSAGFELYADNKGTVEYVRNGRRRKKIHICPECCVAINVIRQSAASKTTD